MSKWPMVPLSEVLKQDVDSELVISSKVYKFAGVYSFARGLFVRGDQLGANTTYKRFNILHENNFVISQPKAWEGAIARVSEEFEGWYLSPVFPTFKPDITRLFPQYLEWYLKRRTVWEELHFLSKGIGARRESVSPSQFLSVKFPLPPLSEQRRLVERIDALASKIEEAQLGTSQIESESHGLLDAAFKEIAATASRRKLGDIAPLNRRPASIDPLASYPGVSVRSFGRGTFHNPPLPGSEITWEKPQLVKAGDILVSNIKAWEGAIAVATPEDDGRYGSHRYLTYTPTPGVAVARFICFFLLTKEGLYHVGEASPGSADRNRTTSAKALMKIPVPVPDIKRQEWFGKLYDKVERIRQLQAETTAGREAILPAILDRAFRGEL